MSQLPVVCPICETGHLESYIEKVETEYEGHKALVDLHCSVCTSCGIETATSEQVRLNKELMLEFIRSVSG